MPLVLERAQSLRDESERAMKAGRPLKADYVYDEVGCIMQEADRKTGGKGPEFKLHIEGATPKRKSRGQLRREQMELNTPVGKAIQTVLQSLPDEDERVEFLSAWQTNNTEVEKAQATGEVFWHTSDRDVREQQIKAASALSGALASFGDHRGGHVNTAGMLNADIAGAIMKASTNAGIQLQTGLTPVSLQYPALMLFPSFSILRNMIPRVVIGGTQKEYKRILAIDTASDAGFVPEAIPPATGRASIMNTETETDTAVFATFGIENFITFAAFYGGSSKIDGADFKPRDVANIVTLIGLFLREEKLIAGANGLQALGQPTGLTANTTQAPSGYGTLTAGTQYDFAVSALSFNGWKVYGATGNGGGSNSKGESLPSTTATITTQSSGAGNKSVTLTWNSVKGAWAYNIYAGAHSGTLYYVGTVYKTNDQGATITAQLSPLTITAVPTGGNVPNTADLTQDLYGFNGLQATIDFAPASSTGNLLDMLGAGFATDNAGGEYHVDSIFKQMYNRVAQQQGPVGLQGLVTSANDKYAFDASVLGGSHPNWTIYLEQGEHVIQGGFSVASVYNRYMDERVPLIVHPYFPAGQMIGLNNNLGKYFPTAALPSPIEMNMAYDALRIDYALNALNWQWGIYSSGVPINYFPPAFAHIYNTGN